MAALEDRVLTKMLQSGTMAEAIRLELTEDHFLSPEPRMIYRYMQQHWFNPATAGSLPTIGRIRRRWPSFTPTAVNDEDDGELRALVAELKMRAYDADARGMVDYFQELVEEDPVDAVRVMRAALTELESKMSSDGTGRGMGLNDILSLAEEHYEGALTGAIYGVPWPWKCLTEDTLGKRAGDFVVFYGRMKSMKTWILLYCACVDFLVNNRRVLVWSREMSKLKLGLRMAALLAQVDYQLFKKGLLPPRVHQRAFEVLRSLVRGSAREDVRRGAARGTRDLLLLAGNEAPRNLEGLKQKVHEFEPDVLYLDSFYHMDTARSMAMNVRWQRVACVAEDVKAYAEDDQVPIVAVHQANRLGEKTYGNTLADLADADVIAREADLIIRVLKSPGYKELYEDEYERELERFVRDAQRRARGPRNSRMPTIKLGKGDKNHINKKLMERLVEQLDVPRVGGELALVLGGNREGVLEAFTIKAVPAYNFEIITDRPDMKAIREWMKEDEKGADDDPPKKQKKENIRTSSAEFSEALSEMKV